MLGSNAADTCQEVDGMLRVRLDICDPGGDKSGTKILESCSTCYSAGRSAEVSLAHKPN